jgi:hypothetical protein
MKIYVYYINIGHTKKLPSLGKISQIVAIFINKLYKIIPLIFPISSPPNKDKINQIPF